MEQLELEIILGQIEHIQDVIIDMKKVLTKMWQMLDDIKNGQLNLL